MVLSGFCILIHPTLDSQDMKETSRIKSSFIHATRGGWEQLPLLKDQLLESQEKLLKAYKELIALEEEKKVREAALAEAREASKKAEEETVLLRERALTVEEVASKAREEALSYKNVIADLDKEKGLLKSDLDSLRESFRKMKVAYVDSEVAKGAAEDVKKKALEDLEVERARSRSLSDDVERLKGELLEKSGAIAQAGKVIEDLRVANTELARSNREIERANTRLVGENTALEESVRGMFLSLDFFFKACLVFAKVPCIALYRAQGRTPGRPSRGSQRQGSARSGGCFEPSSADGDK
jgi:chromosome segregation ATPase